MFDPTEITITSGYNRIRDCSSTKIVMMTIISNYYYYTQRQNSMVDSYIHLLVSIRVNIF